MKQILAKISERNINLNLTKNKNTQNIDCISWFCGPIKYVQRKNVFEVNKTTNGIWNGLRWVNSPNTKKKNELFVALLHYRDESSETVFFFFEILFRNTLLAPDVRAYSFFGSCHLNRWFSFGPSPRQMNFNLICSLLLWFNVSVRVDYLKWNTIYWYKRRHLFLVEYLS